MDFLAAGLLHLLSYTRILCMYIYQYRRTADARWIKVYTCVCPMRVCITISNTLP